MDVLSFEATIWVIRLLIANVVAVSFVGPIMGVQPVIIDHCATISPPMRRLTLRLRYFGGIVLAESAMLPSQLRSSVRASTVPPCSLRGSYLVSQA